MYELCRSRRSEGYEACFDERAVEAQSHIQKSTSFFDYLGIKEGSYDPAENGRRHHCC